MTNPKRTDTPYSFDGSCFVCASKVELLQYVDSWTAVMQCTGCHRVLVWTQGDKMGGQFDEVKTYDLPEPVRN